MERRTQRKLKQYAPLLLGIGALAVVGIASLAGAAGRAGAKKEASAVTQEDSLNTDAELAPEGQNPGGLGAEALPEDSSDTAESTEAVTETEETQPPETEPPETEPPLTEEELAWQEYLMPHAEEYVNVRAEGSEEAEVVGKLYMGDRAHIEEKGDTWTKIESGSVIGYVKNQYCYFGTDALEWAKQNCDRQFEVTGDGLRIRADQSEDAEIIDVVEEGTKLTLDPTVTGENGWAAVYYNDETAYVKGDFVKVTYITGKGVTIEEEIAEREAAEAARKAAEEAERQKEREAEAARRAEEIKLLAAIIEAEAGGEPYEGQIAVGAVVLNRVDSSRFPGSISGVIYQSGQFTPATNGSLAHALSHGPKSSCVKAAKEALLDGVDPTGGALYFGTTMNLPVKCVIGSHTFY
ncbi:MAG: cell wall hydrolase [Clostridium sp.]|nr:cell wall hydrolase [Clostridium sp.]